MFLILCPMLAHVAIFIFVCLIRVKSSVDTKPPEFYPISKFPRLPVLAPPHAAKQGNVILLVCRVIFTAVLQLQHVRVPQLSKII